MVSGTRGRAFESRIAHHIHLPHSINNGNVAMSLVKKCLLLAVLGAILYFALSHHIIITERGTLLLKKSTLTLQYTFFSVRGKSNKTVLAIDALRKDGIGELLKREGRLTEEEEALILESLDRE